MHPAPEKVNAKAHGLFSIDSQRYDSNTATDPLTYQVGIIYMLLSNAPSFMPRISLAMRYWLRNGPTNSRALKPFDLYVASNTAAKAAALMMQAAGEVRAERKTTPKNKPSSAPVVFQNKPGRDR